MTTFQRHNMIQSLISNNECVTTYVNVLLEFNSDSKQTLKQKGCLSHFFWSYNHWSFRIAASYEGIRAQMSLLDHETQIEFSFCSLEQGF